MSLPAGLSRCRVASVLIHPFLRVEDGEEHQHRETGRFAARPVFRVGLRSALTRGFLLIRKRCGSRATRSARNGAHRRFSLRPGCSRSCWQTQRVATDDADDEQPARPRTWMTAGLPMLAECERHKPSDSYATGDRHQQVTTCPGCVAEYLDAKFGSLRSQSDRTNSTTTVQVKQTDRLLAAHRAQCTNPLCACRRATIADRPADDANAETVEARRRAAAAAALEPHRKIG